MQQRLLQLEQMIAQSSALPPAEPHTPTPANTESEMEQFSSLDYLPTRPIYSWTPSPFLNEVLVLDTPLFPMTMISDDDCRKTIDKYPQIDSIQYQSPDTIPSASRKINKYQSKQDMS